MLPSHLVCPTALVYPLRCRLSTAPEFFPHQPGRRKCTRMEEVAAADAVGMVLLLSFVPVEIVACSCCRQFKRAAVPCTRGGRQQQPQEKCLSSFRHGCLAISVAFAGLRVLCLSRHGSALWLPIHQLLQLQTIRRNTALENELLHLLECARPKVS